MITRLAVSGYRSLRDIKLFLGPVTVVTGANGSGKSSLYRALRLLSDAAQGRLIGSLAMEGGLSSTLWAGPERISRDMKSGKYPVQGTVRSGPVSLKLGFSGPDFGYAVDLGLPAPGAVFARDPEIKVEAMWTGELLGRTNLFAERRGPALRLRDPDTGEWRDSVQGVSAFDSMVAYAANRTDGLELLMMRQRMRDWRFYDQVRTDQNAPARRPQPMTFTPVLADNAADLAAAIATIIMVGDQSGFAEVVHDAFPGALVDVAGEDYGSVTMRQTGLLRPLSASELSDGTLRYLMLAAALLSPRPPELMVLNEPESSLHPSLIEPLARLLSRAAEGCQIVVVSHNPALVQALTQDYRAEEILLEKNFGETTSQASMGLRWNWPSR